MKNNYLVGYFRYLKYPCLVLLYLLVPTAVSAQALVVQAASGNTLPLQDFGNIPVSRTSAAQSFLISGTSLSDDVTITAPDGFQTRVGSNTFSTNAITLTPADGTLRTTTIDVRFAPVSSSAYPDGTGTYMNSIVATTSTGAGTTATSVAVSGTAPSGPYVFVDPTILAFGQVSGSGSGQVLTFTVGGDNLGTMPLTLVTALTGSTPSGGIQVRNPAVAGSTFATSLTLTPVNGKVPATTIQARIVGPVASQSNFTGTITATSGEAIAAPSNGVQVTGNNAFTGSNSSSTFTVSTPPTNPLTPGYPSGGQPLQPFNTVPEKASASQTLLVSGSFLVNGILVRAPANFQVSLDGTFTGLGAGGAGTVTANSLTINPVNGKVENVLVYVRYVPLVASKESGTAINFSSSPATSIGTTVAANSIGTIESRTVFTKPNPLVIGNNVQSAPQLIRIHAELVRNPTRISVSGESTNAQGNPNGYAQFRISTDGVTYTDPANASTNYIQLTPDPSTNIIDQDLYVIYAPTRVGAAQAVLQYITPDVTASPANTTTPIISSFSGPTANQLRGTAIDIEPTRDTPFQAARNVGDASASISFQPDANFSGYGEFHLVLISTQATLTVPDIMPLDGTDYNASNGAFRGTGQSTLSDSQGNLYYVVSAGGAPTATITGLNPQTTYYAYVFDYNSTNLYDDNDPSQPGTTLISNAENYKGPAQSTVFGVMLPGATPLPVGLSAFTAQVTGPTAVRVVWATATEMNNAGFTVERSVAGQPFQAVGTVAGAGSSNTTNAYSLLDAKLPTGASLLYYRLRQTDLDGTNTYSPIRALTVAPSKSATLAQLLAYPNPAHQVAHVRLLGPATTAPLEVFDALGHLVRTQTAPLGGQELMLPLTGLPTGLYILRCGKLNQRLHVE
jgi:hypothetical protein